MSLLEKNNQIGSVMVVGAGVAGMQAALDLANSGLLVYLLDRQPTIGGIMAQLDKTFPTNDCSMCMISPKLVEVGRHINIDVLPDSEVMALEGEAGNFTAVVNSYPRYIDPVKCTACGECRKVCPVTAINEFNAGLDSRTATYIRYPQAVPLAFAIDRNSCLGCGLCSQVCLAGAVNYGDAPVQRQLAVGAVVLAPGNRTFDPGSNAFYNDVYGYANLPNVVTSLEFERILSASGPYRGHLMRPYDREEPKKIAWLQCVGSRDVKTHTYCSAVCCMYAIKEAVIAKEHAHHGLDTAIFYMDMRTYGKDFEQYYQRAQKEHGVRFIRYRIQSLEPAGEGDVKITYVDHTGKKQAEVFNMVVLSVGFEVAPEVQDLARRLGIEVNRHHFAATGPFQPVTTSRAGVYVCGTFQGPKDIPQSVMEASAAAASCSALLGEARWTRTRTKDVPAERVDLGGRPRIGVFVCNCGINIAGVVDVPAVRDYAATLPNVVYVEDNLFTCSQDTQVKIAQVIAEKNINRVVVASCSPLTHEPMFQETIRSIGLNKYLFDMANIRNQDSWVHIKDKDKATRKAKDLVRQAVARAGLLKPLAEKPLHIDPKALVVGGGIAGMNAALNLAAQGFGTYLIEKQKDLGGLAGKIHHNIEGMDVGAYLHDLIAGVRANDNIEILTEAEVVRHSGYKGNFVTTIAVGPEKQEHQIEHGATIIATGAVEQRPHGFLYGEDKRVLTQLELDEFIHRHGDEVANWQRVVMIQCIGSRNDDNPNCSRICCQSAVKHALQLRKIAPRLDIIILYRDMRMYGLLEDYYQEARSQGIIFARFDLEHQPRVTREEGRLQVSFVDEILGRPLEFPVDAIILSTATVAADTDHLAAQLKVQKNAYGFFMEAHPKLRPVDFSSEGVYLCGMAHGPKLISESIAQALAAASRAGAFLADTSQTISAIVSHVGDGRCAACLVCVRSCPYGVPHVREGRSEINEALCQGCGICAAECPARIIELSHYEDKQVAAKIEAR